MDVKELRIGNWVYDEDGILSRIIGFSPFDHSVRCDEEEGCEILIDLYPQDGSTRRGYIIESCYIYPVVVTSDTLEKFGFIRGKDFGGYTNIFYNEGFMVSLDEYINVFVDWAWAEEGSNSYHSIVCYEELHVHTLQNLFFLLKGKELEFKLK